MCVIVKQVNDEISEPVRSVQCAVCSVDSAGPSGHCRQQDGPVATDGPQAKLRANQRFRLRTAESLLVSDRPPHHHHHPPSHPSTPNPPKNPMVFTAVREKPINNRVADSRAEVKQPGGHKPSPGAKDEGGAGGIRKKKRREGEMERH